jgi:hypothetical protein
MFIPSLGNAALLSPSNTMNNSHITRRIYAGALSALYRVSEKRAERVFKYLYKRNPQLVDSINNSKQDCF